MFGIAEGSVLVEVNPDDPSITVPIEEGSIFGEVGLISGRRRGSTVRAAEPTVVMELSRTAALKLMATAPSAARAVNAISIERQLLQMFGSGLSKTDIEDVVATAEVKTVKAGEKVVMFYNSGNRDERTFPDPYAFDITREPNPAQIGFGAGGPHFCLGANLARREITVMFDVIRGRLPSLRATGEPAYLQSGFINGIKRLQCAWH
jgi:hypothetical protein